MSNIVSEADIELENVFQEVFMKCDASIRTCSMTHSTVSGEVLSISNIVQYIQEQLPTWSDEHAVELCRCLSSVATNDRVNLQQFLKATIRCFARMLQTQDDNNNVAREFYRSMDDSVKISVDKDVADVKLRMRVRRYDEENITLREDLAQSEDLIANLKRQCANLEHQLDRYTKRCQQLESENDEQKNELDRMTKNEKGYVSAIQKSARKCDKLSNQLENAEVEVQAIQPLKEQIEKFYRKERDYVRQANRLQEELYEKEDECEKLRATMTELQDTNSSIKEIYENTILNLRERICQLEDEIVEYQSWVMFQGEKLLLSPTSSVNRCLAYSPSGQWEKEPLENSLYMELKASDFMFNCGNRNSCPIKLQEELTYYDTVISAILEELEKIMQHLAEITGSTQTPQADLPRTDNAERSKIEALRHQVALLLSMVTEKIARNKGIDSSTQLRADCTDATDNLELFGITHFRASLTSARQCPRPETGLQSTASQDVRDAEDDPFLRVAKTSTSVPNSDLNEIFDPVKELGIIIEEMESPAAHKDRASGSPRYKSSTLDEDACVVAHATSTPSPTGCSSSAEDATLENTILAGSCKSSRGNPLDVGSAASDDGPARGSFDEKSADVETEPTCDVPGRESALHIEDISHQGDDEAPKESGVLRVNSKAPVASGETSTKNFQAPELVLTSPRRKLSVYRRPFDVVKMRSSSEGDESPPCLEMKRSPSDSPERDDEKKRSGESDDDAAADDEVAAGDRVGDQRNAPKYLFNHCYRDVTNESDSSNSCSPQKRFSDDELSPLVQSPVRRQIYLAPVRLKVPRKNRKSGEGADDPTEKSAKGCASSGPDTSSSDSITPWSFCSTADSNRSEKDDDDDGEASAYSSATSTVDKCEATIGAALERNSCSVNQKFPQGQLTPVHAMPHNQIDPAKIADSGDPHSRASVQSGVNGDRPRVEQSVDSQMSSREDTSADEDSESAKPRCDRCVNGEVTMGANETEGTANAVLPLNGPPTKRIPCGDAAQSDGETRDRNLFDAEQKRRQRSTVRRSLSEGDKINIVGRASWLQRCEEYDRPQTAPLIQTSNNQVQSFPSLTCARLRECGIANLPDTEINSRENLSEFELQKRCIAFSLGLWTDRLTLSRRMEVSLRQRDQSEKNLVCEVQKMQQDIQDLAPLCTDRESVERVERVRHQLDMVARCAHRVSCAAETLGAVHQEHRISRAIFLADRYLHLLQSRCEKLAANVAETKRILTENNIVIEENCGELGDDLPRIRYRSGTPANNRMMMARRRASVATMSRPMGNTQDVTKDTLRQRNSVSGRMMLRRPSLNYESSKWENEKLGRTDSSSSVSELRGIFEHAESRRGSEENNNMIRNQSSSQSVINSAGIDEVWSYVKPESRPEHLPVDEDVNRDCRTCARSAQSSRSRGAGLSWRAILCCILFFFLGFYVNLVVSSVDRRHITYLLEQWHIKRIFNGYIRTERLMPNPI